MPLSVAPAGSTVSRARMGTHPALLRWHGALCLLWAGVLVGISFIEAPAKFRAPSLTLPVALDVGRHVFGASHGVQLGFGAVALLLLVLGRPREALWTWLGVALGVLAVQHVWLLPALDARVGLVLAGQTPPPSLLHVAFIGVELLKLGALLTAGVLSLQGAPAAALEKA